MIEVKSLTIEMTYVRSTIAIFSLAILSACAAPTKNLTASDAIAAGQGVVVTQLESNWTGYDNPFKAKLAVEFKPAGSRRADLKFLLSKANDFKVVALPAGEYRWEEISFDSYHMPLDDSDGFTVKPGEITYIGNINIQLNLKLFSMSGVQKVIDREAEVKATLQAEYPKLISSHPFSKRLTTLRRN